MKPKHISEKKKEPHEFCNFLEQNMVSKGGKSNTEVDKQKSVQEGKEY